MHLDVYNFDQIQILPFFLEMLWSAYIMIMWVFPDPTGLRTPASFYFAGYKLY